MSYSPRFCLWCGGRLRTIRENGHRRRRCPRCGWTFYDNPVPASVAIIRQRGRVLLTRRAHPPYAGTWDLPGGFLEAGEQPEAGLKRELREELAVRVRGARLIGFATDRYGPRGFPVLTLVYRVTIAPGVIRPDDDVSEARWFDRRRLPFQPERNARGLTGFHDDPGEPHGLKADLLRQDPVDAGWKQGDREDSGGIALEKGDPASVRALDRDLHADDRRGFSGIKGDAAECAVGQALRSGDPSAGRNERGGAEEDPDQRSGESHQRSHDRDEEIGVESADWVPARASRQSGRPTGYLLESGCMSAVVTQQFMRVDPSPCSEMSAHVLQQINTSKQP